MPKYIVLLKPLVELGYTVCFVRDGCLITVDHRILIGYNTFLCTTRASNCDVTAINCSITIFLLACT